MSNAGTAARGSRLPGTAAAAVGLAGVGFIGVGLWGRRDVVQALAAERIVDTPRGRGHAGAPVATPREARSLAELIRGNTIRATGGRTYAETDPYVDADGAPTADIACAIRDERTGQALENPSDDLWVQSMTLQTALMQAYVAFRLAELTVALGVSFLGVAVGLSAGGRRSRR